MGGTKKLFFYLYQNFLRMSSRSYRGTHEMCRHKLLLLNRIMIQEKLGYLTEYGKGANRVAIVFCILLLFCHQ